MLDILIVVRNRPALTVQTFQSLIPTLRETERLYIADNDSDSKLQDYLVRLPCHAIKLFEQNLNVGGCTDYFLENWMTSPIVVSAANDVIFHPNWQEDVLKAFEIFPRLGTLGLWRHPFHIPDSSQEKDGMTLYSMQQMCGCAQAIRREAFIEVGGMGSYLDKPETWRESDEHGNYIDVSDTKLQERLIANNWMVGWLGKDYVDHIGYEKTTRSPMDGYEEVMKCRGK